MTREQVCEGHFNSFRRMGIHNFTYFFNKKSDKFSDIGRPQTFKKSMF